MPGPRVTKAQRDAVRETERRAELAARIRRIGRGHRDPVAFYRKADDEQPAAVGTVAALETDAIVLSNFGQPDGTGTRIPWSGCERVGPPPESLPDDPTIEQLATLELPTPETCIDYREAVEARFARIAEVARAQADEQADEGELHSKLRWEAEQEAESVGGGELGHLSIQSFEQDLDGNYPAGVVSLFELRDGATCTDRAGRGYRRVGPGPVQGSVEISSTVDDTRAYIDGTARVRKVGT